MKIFSEKVKLTGYLNKIHTLNSSVGFVPTMGALHTGHLSLINIALNNNTDVVVSIFVNPTQFNNLKDLKTYPRTIEADVEFLKTISPKLILYTPSVEDIYHTTISSEAFNFGGIENEMEGAYRPGHFNGVATVVKKLFEIVKPNNAYFGEKDFQQLQIIKQLVKQYKLPVKINSCPIHREADGLAMSSRNVKLSQAHRKVAPFIYKTLKTAKVKFGTKSAKVVTEWVRKQFKNQLLLELEYFTIANEETLKPIKRKSSKNTYRAFIAVYAGDVRLIDNIALN